MAVGNRGWHMVRHSVYRKPSDASALWVVGGDNNMLLVSSHITSATDPPLAVDSVLLGDSELAGMTSGRSVPWIAAALSR